MIDRQRGLALQRAGLRGFMEVLSARSAGGELFTRAGVAASVVPATPRRSVCNSVVYEDASALQDALPELAAVYEGAGVSAWTVWVPEEERDAAGIVEAAGHLLDASPRAMVRELATLPEPEPGDLDWDVDASARDVGWINDAAYGLSNEFVRALGSGSVAAPTRLYQARVDGEPVSVLGTIDVDGDCAIFLVATLDGYRGRGLSRRLLHVALHQARERGLETTSLQATKLGYPVYERLGYAPLCALEMWERRRT
jgi:GNAT superfamily N-acetyltransferase